MNAGVPGLNAFLDLSGDVGEFVSEYMAYHGPWYRDWSNANFGDPCLKCLIAGHTHVGVQVTAAQGEAAVEIALDEVIKQLPKP